MIDNIRDYSMAIFHLEELSRYKDIENSRFNEDNSIHFLYTCMEETLSGEHPEIAKLKDSYNELLLQIFSNDTTILTTNDRVFYIFSHKDSTGAKEALSNLSIETFDSNFFNLPIFLTDKGNLYIPAEYDPSEKLTYLGTKKVYIGTSYKRSENAN